MKNDDVGTLLGCSLFGGIILAKVVAFVLIVYVAWHFISKYW